MMGAVFLSIVSFLVTPIHADEALVPPKSDSADAVSAWVRQTAAPQEKPSNPTLKRKKTPASQTPRQADGGLTSLPYGKMIWPLAAVLGTIGLVAWLLRKWAVGGGRLGTTGAINVLARHYLSSKQSLCLVRLGRRAVLLGITPEHISAVADLGDSDESAAFIAGIERGRPGSFSTALGDFSTSRFSGVPHEQIPDAVLEETSSRVQNLVDRLKSCTAGT
jgi:flagellar biogenesis protein FliO